MGLACLISTSVSLLFAALVCPAWGAYGEHLYQVYDIKFLCWSEVAAGDPTSTPSLPISFITLHWRWLGRVTRQLRYITSPDAGASRQPHMKQWGKCWSSNIKEADGKRLDNIKVLALMTNQKASGCVDLSAPTVSFPSCHTYCSVKCRNVSCVTSK